MSCTYQLPIVAERLHTLKLPIPTRKKKKVVAAKDKDDADGEGAGGRLLTGHTHDQQKRVKRSDKATLTLFYASLFFCLPLAPEKHVPPICTCIC